MARRAHKRDFESTFFEIRRGRWTIDDVLRLCSRLDRQSYLSTPKKERLGRAIIRWLQYICDCESVPGIEPYMEYLQKHPDFFFYHRAKTNASSVDTRTSIREGLDNDLKYAKKLWLKRLIYGKGAIVSDERNKYRNRYNIDVTMFNSEIAATALQRKFPEGSYYGAISQCIICARAIRRAAYSDDTIQTLSRSVLDHFLFLIRHDIVPLHRVLDMCHLCVVRDRRRFVPVIAKAFWKKFKTYFNWEVVFEKNITQQQLDMESALFRDK